ncbi:MAG: hypothetical protein P8M27_02240 [Flavobacteriaceae bacterium]|nr:hypothetical protein [Flavobacteriaceae bacterium]|tara:strand:- start:7121 stop:7576 length:456 start_codon:yes stop_codon:yes gene_type:complete
MLTKEDIIKAQKEWAEGIIKMGKISNDRLSLESFVSDFLDNAYNFQADVLFKPTKAKAEQFRNDKESATSYFIAGNNKKCEEDEGFALSKWLKVTFNNSNIIINQNQGLAMGNYTFENDDTIIKVEYSFGYIKVNESVKIILHHSSIPFQS